MNTGPSSPGAQGIDAQNSFNGVTDNGSQLSNDRFNTTGGTAVFSALGNNNGVQGNIDLSGVLSELSLYSTLTNGFAQTDTENISSLTNTTKTFDFQDGSTDFIVFDIVTGGNDLSLSNVNWVVEGDLNDIVIFRVEDDAALVASDSAFLLGGDIGVSNVMFYVDADQGVESFNFNNVEFFGYSFWDLDGDSDNVGLFSDVRGCGQLVIDQVDFSNVSMTHCSFDTSQLPEPSAVLLMGAAGLALVFRRGREMRRG
ncbi:MAG: PEP-CTERM sorting domain-containing protein [Verrucomicrobiota bacterium]